MAFIEVPATVEIDINFTSSGTFFAQCTRYARYTGGGTITTSILEGLHEEIIAGGFAVAGDALTTAVDGMQINYRDLTTQAGAIFTAASIDPGGNITSPGLPLQDTLTVVWRTGIAGRSFRGRNYHPILWESAVASNTVDVMVVEDILAWWGALHTTINGIGGWEHVVVSRYADGAPRAAGIATPIVSWNTSSPRVKTQRRRLKNYA